ncbi:MAG: methyltransferase domain-containing protein [Lachnospiraceae bacterium]|nr:methyltransferase domain-containing protein [Lachnospiraceae bacterium]
MKEYEYIKNYISEKAKSRKIGIFGTGKGTPVAEELLQELNVDNYVYIDNDITRQNCIYHNKQVIDPSVLDKEWFVLVSNQYFREISWQLEKMGLQEQKDYIWVFDMAYYDGLLRYSAAPQVPEISLKDMKEIEELLSKFVSVERVDWFDKIEFTMFEQTLDFSKEYYKSFNRRYRRKMMEYYFVSKILDFDHWNTGDIYLDIASASSPFAMYLREKKGINAYALDLEQGAYKDKEYYLQEDATHMHFGNNAVAAISMQSGFEMFVGKTDIDFIKEAGRVLKPEGKVVILPLYMYTIFLSTVSPNYYHKGYADEGALECIRTDCGDSVPLGRFYSVEKLKERVLDEAEKNELSVKILTLPDDIVENDLFVYLKFILVLQKIGEKR